jgi:predicted GNAT family acetyltransferase
MKSIRIIEINPLDEEVIINEALSHKLTYHENSKIFGLYLNGVIVSVASTEELKRQIVIKFQYTKSEYRNKGYGLTMLKYCIDYCKKTTNKKIVASCMPMSLKLHLSQGAKIIRHCKDGGAMVYYENI